MATRSACPRYTCEDEVYGPEEISGYDLSLSQFLAHELPLPDHLDGEYSTTLRDAERVWFHYVIHFNKDFQSKYEAWENDYEARMENQNDAFSDSE